MKRLLLPLCTVVSTLAGWYFAQGYRSTSLEVKTPPAVTPASTTARETSLNTGPDSLEVVSTVERIAKGYDRYSFDQQIEFGARLYAELQDMDPTGFASAIATLLSTENFKSRYAAKLLVGFWAERDLPAALEWILHVEKDEGYYGRLIFGTWNRLDTRGMFAWLEAHADEIKSDELKSAALYIISKDASQLDPERAMQVLAAFKSKDSKRPYDNARIYGVWAKQAPAAAAARALNEPDGISRLLAVQSIVSSWSERDHRAARAWAEKIPDPVLSGRALATIGSSVASRDPKEAADLLVSIPRTDEARKALGSVLNSWRDKDLNAALQWLDSVSDESLGIWAMREVSKDMPADKLENAIALLPEGRRSNVENRWQQALRAAESGAASNN